jgi:hypothetical protein
MNTNEILREEKQNKAPGTYQITNYYSTYTPYSYNPGNNNGTLGLNPNKISDDSFLKNLQIKNNKTIKGNNNYIYQKQDKIDYVDAHIINDTRNKKSCNDINEMDYFKLGYRTNDALKNAKNMASFYIGIDSRHSKR